MDRHASPQPAQTHGGGRAGGEGGRGPIGGRRPRRGLTPILPIHLLADSRPLFWQGGESLLAAARTALPERPRAAYLGAANGDDPAFYAIFQGAMEGAGIHDRRMILAGFPPEDRDFLARADLIVLAGGDPVRGWRAFEAAGIGEAVVRRYYGGALLIGVSAGAVQLGWGTWEEAAPDSGQDTGESAGELVGTFRLVPFFVGAHEEADDWRRLERTVAASGTGVAGLGIPAGGAALYHSGGPLEPRGRPAIEITPAGDGAPPVRNVLVPAAGRGELTV